MPEKHVGRPPSPHPRNVRLVVRLTEAEALEYRAAMVIHGHPDLSATVRAAMERYRKTENDWK